MDDEQFFESILNTGDNYQFKPLKTTVYSCIHAIISLTISVLGALLALFWKNDEDCQEYFMILYLRCVYWVITFLYDFIIKHHHEKLRMNGYHEFYRSTLLHKGIALNTVSLWNTIILAIQTLMQDQYGPSFFAHCPKDFFSPTTYIVLFSAFETVLLLMAHGWYVLRVNRFNKATPAPDAFRGLSENLNSVGVVTRDAETNDLLEKQADLINYLKDHNNKLNQKLMMLNAQIRSSASGITPQN